MSDIPKDLRRARAQGDDLKEQIIALIEKHPARENGALVFAALVELGLTLAVSQFGPQARDIWIGAFDAGEIAQRKQKG
jgi:hypothetical protein